MGQPFIGQLKLFGGNFAPAGWATCDGQLMAISENDTLFNLIGTTFGGDGQETFAMPNLAGRISVHQGSDPSGINYIIGELGGVSSVTLTGNQIPVHSHPLVAGTNNGTINNPGNAFLAGGQSIYESSTPNQAMNAGALLTQGGSQPHENMQPYLALTWIISLYGIYPTQS